MSYTHEQLNLMRTISNVDLHLRKWLESKHVYPGLWDTDRRRDHMDQLLDRRLELMRQNGYRSATSLETLAKLF